MVGALGAQRYRRCNAIGALDDLRTVEGLERYRRQLKAPAVCEIDDESSVTGGGDARRAHLGLRAALPAAPLAHGDGTVGSVVYLAPSIFHHASPIGEGGRRLVFCLFYAGDGDLSQHALAASATRQLGSWGQ